MNKIITKINDLGLEMLDDNIYKTDGTNMYLVQENVPNEVIELMKENHRKWYEEKTGLKIIHSIYKTIPNIKEQGYIIQSIYYFVGEIK